MFVFSTDDTDGPLVLSERISGLPKGDVTIPGMSTSSCDLPALPCKRDDFATTHWSLVIAAGQGRPAEAHQALAALCQAYWYPLFAYVRRHTGDLNTAQDLTQAFFVHLLEKGAIAAAASDRGRFRAFLLACLKNFLVSEHARENALKRGGGQSLVRLDFGDGDSRLSLEPATTLTPEKIFDRQWTLTLLDRVLARLEAELQAAGKGSQFTVLQALLAGPCAELSYADAAQALGTTPEAARQAVHRLRKRYREILKEEVGRTIADPADVEDEIRSLLESL
jgi:RNA polymerase sigma factor (sigma-70 family)